LYCTYINFTVQSGKCPLHIAAAMQQLPHGASIEDLKGIVSLLIENGADVDMIDEVQWHLSAYVVRVI
jgi:ankyrin repeat protein